MNPGSNTESYPAFAHIGLRENPGKNLNQVTCPNRESNPGHLVSRLDSLTRLNETKVIMPGSSIESYPAFARKKPQPSNLPRPGFELGPPGFAARLADRYSTVNCPKTGLNLTSDTKKAPLIKQLVQEIISRNGTDGKTYWNFKKLRQSESNASAFTVKPSSRVRVIKGDVNFAHSHATNREETDAKNVKANLKRMAGDHPELKPGQILRNYYMKLLHVF
ncbi:hypothetical protein ANN_22493 [Periplaneta americana]|uniref:Uncharacterized protein n=1 Tax=Periplaneta americana TaxID=6978 RepID=A0ABQ8S945_PERAM|nr:hypothetical protein ANN_22493 [Periplaneta americana]